VTPNPSPPKPPSSVIEGEFFGLYVKKVEDNKKTGTNYFSPVFYLNLKVWEVQGMRSERDWRHPHLEL